MLIDRDFVQLAMVLAELIRVLFKVALDVKVLVSKLFSGKWDQECTPKAVDHVRIVMDKVK